MMVIEQKPARSRRTSSAGSTNATATIIDSFIRTRRKDLSESNSIVLNKICWRKKSKRRRRPFHQVFPHYHQGERSMMPFVQFQLSSFLQLVRKRRSGWPSTAAQLRQTSMPIQRNVSNSKSKLRQLIEALEFYSHLLTSCQIL